MKLAVFLIGLFLGVGAAWLLVGAPASSVTARAPAMAPAAVALPVAAPTAVPVTAPTAVPVTARVHNQEPPITSMSPEDRVAAQQPLPARSAGKTRR